MNTLLRLWGSRSSLLSQEKPCFVFNLYLIRDEIVIFYRDVKVIKRNVHIGLALFLLASVPVMAMEKNPEQEEQEGKLQRIVKKKSERPRTQSSLDVFKDSNSWTNFKKYVNSQPGNKREKFNTVKTNILKEIEEKVKDQENKYNTLLNDSQQERKRLLEQLMTSQETLKTKEREFYVREKKQNLEDLQRKKTKVLEKIAKFPSKSEVGNQIEENKKKIENAQKCLQQGKDNQRKWTEDLKNIIIEIDNTKNSLHEGDSLPPVLILNTIQSLDYERKFRNAWIGSTTPSLDLLEMQINELLGKDHSARKSFN